MPAPAETVVLSSGVVEYSAEKAAIPIEDLIEALEEAREDGAEFVLMSTGNHRGAQWIRLSAELTWIRDL